MFDIGAVAEPFEYLLGVIHGDGYVRATNNGTSYQLSVPVSIKDEGYKEVLKQIFVNTYDYAPHERMHNNCFYLEVFKKEIVKPFIGYKINGRWIIPKLKYPHEYLAGLWDTDGYIAFHEYRDVPRYVKKNNRFEKKTHVGRTIELRQKSNGNLNLIIPILSSLGFCPTLREYTYKNKLGIFKMDVLKILTLDFPLFKKMITIRHPRKKGELEKVVHYKPRWRNQFSEGLISMYDQIYETKIPQLLDNVVHCETKP